MADDTYTANSDGSCYVGMFNRPSWVLNQPLNTWGVIPATNVLADINPENNPLLNPLFPGKPEWSAVNNFPSIINAWCGASFDFLEQELRITLPAGHADYAGGEPYSLRIKTENPSWVMLHPPTGALPEMVLTDDEEELSGLYANGRPRAIHSYNKSVFIPGYGHAVVPQGSTSWSGQKGTLRPVIFDSVTGEMSLFGASIGLGSAGDYSGGGTCYDQSRNCVWVRRQGTGRFHRYYPATDSWQLNVSGLLATGGDTSLTYIPEHDCILWMDNLMADNNIIRVLDCATGQHFSKTISGVAVGTTLNGRSNPAQFEPNKFAFWNNFSDTTVINVLSFDTDPLGGNWSVSQMPMADNNAVTPTIAAVNGTFGRWFHSAELGLFGVVNHVSQPTYFYRYK